MNYGVSKLGAGITSSFIYLQPFFATVASMLLLHEQLTYTKMLSAAIIMLGVFISNYKPINTISKKL
jgi:drug/metabolite transporter (DMT)-like permease